MKLVKFIYFLIIVATFSSCTVLQWRSTDAEIYDRFSSLNIPTEISYYTADTLDIKVRAQKIKQVNNTINILFLHGSPSSLSAWNGYLKDTSLIKQANLYAIDRPGYGYSNFGDELVSIKLQAEIISKLICTYKLDNVITVGSSYGGPLAARLAVINTNVKGVVMISPAIDPEQEKRVKGQKFTQFWLTRWLVPTGYRVAGDEKETHAKELSYIDADWPKVSVPVIHIHGDKDDLVPYGNINYTKKKFKNNNIITTPNTGHEIAWARPELIKPHLYKLIQNIANSIAK
ncbi:alpha/beta fold hydrolase [Winogradskyella immobilis]|uniref:Alpha/beta hydrolase n=1 Tax=Winogradskyella immobilis TaxID=2816852 RepID=A0ABS8ELR4_9FLAO|nr:alpha/beta hydrolase [Winogradskyella immobilis]MCC1484035.1 alpha/beta hydrolase [Winogradskyella immobilis]MCG0016127.1 alpha/beta hydrolase [Winogradskyella immobilis]